MKRTILAAIILTTMLWSYDCGAQGTLYLSDLGQSSNGSNAIGSDSWTAQVFFTGTNAGGYELNSISLLMNPPSGNPIGFSVSIYSSLNPTSNLGTLNGSNPLIGGIFSYFTSGSGIMLSPSTAYSVVVKASTSVVNGAYYWSTTSGIEVDGVDRWSLTGHLGSNDGLNWNPEPRGSVFQMAIYATAIPEPSTLALIFIGGGLLIYVCRRNKITVHCVADSAGQTCR
jgi:hypothetical protein